MAKGKRLKLLKGEKLMIALIIFLGVLIPIVNVYTSSLITRTNIEKEELKKNVEKQKSENESLEMQKDELSSLDNIQSVVKEYGLSYDNTNVVVIK